mgnify:FL=1
MIENNLPLSIFIITTSLSFFMYIIHRVKIKKISERESIIWLLAGTIILMFSMFPVLLHWLSQLLGIVYNPTTLFLIAIFGLIYILLRKEEQIHILNEKNKELSQRIAILEFSNLLNK